MARKRYTEEQIISVLNEAEAAAKTVELCRKHGGSEGTEAESCLLRLRHAHSGGPSHAQIMKTIDLIGDRSIPYMG